ncbi:hypothetical protein BHM03_00046058 [Ensete ventricosum]|nr:hypothetical protein BHM03_00046058 [Ensete ventricosum]
MPRGAASCHVERAMRLLVHGFARATRNTVAVVQKAADPQRVRLRRPDFRVWTLRRNTGSQILRGERPHHPPNGEGGGNLRVTITSGH